MLVFGGIMGEGMVLRILFFCLPGNLWFALHVADPWCWRLPVTLVETGTHIRSFVEGGWEQELGCLFCMLFCSLGFRHKNIFGL